MNSFTCPQYRGTMIGKAIAIVSIVCVVGCGPSACTITGNVTYDSKPLDNGTIRFRPLGRDIGGGAVAPVQRGEYRVEGILAGDYRVQITAERKTGRKVRQPDSESGKVAMEDEIVQYLPIKYNARTTLNVVLEDGENVRNFDLDR